MAGWWASRVRSLTVFTGLKVSAGTSMKIVFQSLIAPFQSPGNSDLLQFDPLKKYFEL